MWKGWGMKTNKQKDFQNSSSRVEIILDSPSCSCPQSSAMLIFTVISLMALPSLNSTVHHCNYCLAFMSPTWLNPILPIVLLHLSSWTWLVRNTQPHWLFSLHIYNHTTQTDPQHFPSPLLHFSFSHSLRKLPSPLFSPKISKLSPGWYPD